MNITGSHAIDALRGQVWTALHDPAVLARTLPGCQALEVIGPDRYAATVTLGVASITGTYRGEVELVDKHEPEHTTLRMSGAGGPGTVEADATVHLHEDDGATRVEYAATAVVGGTVGEVGQRVLSGVAQRTARDFFEALERDLHGEVPVEAAPTAGGGPGAPADTAAAGGEAGKVSPGAAGRPAGATSDEDRRRTELVGAMVLGALIALVTVLVGRRIAD